VNFDAFVFPAHVRAELDAGRLWRAKEIMASRAAQKAGDPDVHVVFRTILTFLRDL
jgi:hypothetical protein